MARYSRRRRGRIGRRGRRSRRGYRKGSRTYTVARGGIRL